MLLTGEKGSLIYKSRIDTCKKCKSFNNGWCGKKLIKTVTTCGCYMLVKAKIISSNCPQKKW